VPASQATTSTALTASAGLAVSQSPTALATLVEMLAPASPTLVTTPLPGPAQSTVR